MLLETLEAALLKNDSVGSSVRDCVSCLPARAQDRSSFIWKREGRLPLLYPERGDKAEP